MKRFALGGLLFLGGLMGIIELISSAVLYPNGPWTYMGIEGWFAVILGMKLLIPFIIFCLITVAGLALCIYESYRKNSKQK